MRTFLACAFLLCASLAWPQTAQTSTGTAVLDVGNRRDIGHDNNTEARQKLIQAAILDAVERVVAIDISVTTELHVTEQRTSGAAAFHELYMNEVLQRYHVKWSRSGDYTFSRDPSSGKVWVCTTTGLVEQLPSAGASLLSADPLQIAPYILAKRGAAVYLSPGTGAALVPGQRYEVVDHIRMGTKVPRARAKGRILVVESESGYPPLARIISGRYSIRERHTLRPETFPILRGGLRLGYFVSDAWPSLKEDATTRQITGLAFDYFEQSLLDGLGITLGIDLFTDQTTDSTRFQSMAVRLGGTALVPLVPEVLYLRSTASIGYAQPHQVYQINGQVMLQGQLDLCLNLGLLDLSIGMRYTHLLTDPGINGSYAIGSLGLDLYRFIPATQQRTIPGLRAILKNLSLR